MRTIRASLIYLSFLCIGADAFAGIDRALLAGQWRQNNERCTPPPRNKAAVYEMKVDIDGTTLRVQIRSNNGKGERTQELTFEIGGKETVYTGLDGDEYHSKVRWNGDALVFTNVEHERGKLIPSEETWTLIDSGKALQRTKAGSGVEDESKRVYVFDRLP